MASFSNLDCPHCGEQAVSLLQKAFITRSGRACRACRQGVGTRGKDAARVLPIFFLVPLTVVLAGYLGESVPLAVVLGGGILCLAVVYPIFGVRLEPRVSRDRPSLEDLARELTDEH